MKWFSIVAIKAAINTRTGPVVGQFTYSITLADRADITGLNPTFSHPAYRSRGRQHHHPAGLTGRLYPVLDRSPYATVDDHGVYIVLRARLPSNEIL